LNLKNKKFTKEDGQRLINDVGDNHSAHNGYHSNKEDSFVSILSDDMHTFDSLGKDTKKLSILGE